MDITDLVVEITVAGILLILAMMPFAYTHLRRKRATKTQIRKMMHDVKRLMGQAIGSTELNNNLAARHKQYRQRLETARSLLDNILSMSSTYPKALHYYALYHIETGRLDLAEKSFNQAIHSDKANPIAYHNLGNLYFERKEYGKSILHYKRAIQIDPNFDLPYVGMGNIKFHQGKLYSAMGSYSRASRLNHNNADALIGIGNCYKANNRYEKAIGCYEHAYKLNKTNEHLNAVLSEMYIARNEYDKANKILMDAIDQYPSSSVFYIQLGDVKSKLNKEADAVEAYTNFLRLKCENESLSKFIKSKFESYLAVEIISDLLKKQKKINYDQFIKDLNNVVTMVLIKQRVLGRLTNAKKKAYLRFSSYFIDTVVVSIAQNKNWHPPKTADQAILAS